MQLCTAPPCGRAQRARGSFRSCPASRVTAGTRAGPRAPGPCRGAVHTGGPCFSGAIRFRDTRGSLCPPCALIPRQRKSSSILLRCPQFGTTNKNDTMGKPRCVLSSVFKRRPRWFSSRGGRWRDGGTRALGRPCTPPLCHRPSHARLLARRTGAVSPWLVHAERLREARVSSVQPGPLPPAACPRPGRCRASDSHSDENRGFLLPASLWHFRAGRGQWEWPGGGRTGCGLGSEPGAAVCPGFSPRLHWEPSPWLQPAVGFRALNAVHVKRETKRNSLQFLRSPNKREKSIFFCHQLTSATLVASGGCHAVTQGAGPWVAGPELRERVWGG